MSTLIKATGSMTAPLAGTPIARGALLIKDTFSVAANSLVGRATDAIAGKVRAVWAGEPDMMAVSGGRATRGTGTVGTWFNGFEMATNDYEVSVLVAALPTGGQQFLDARRGTGGSPDCYRLSIGTATIDLRKRVGGVTTAFGSAPYAAGDRIGLRVRGNIVSMVLNDVVVNQITDASIPNAGSAGIAGTLATAGVAFDDFEIRAA